MDGGHGNWNRRNRDWRGVDSRHNDALNGNGDALDRQGNALNRDGDDWVRRLGNIGRFHFLIGTSKSGAGEGGESQGDGDGLHFCLEGCVVGWFF